MKYVCRNTGKGISVEKVGGYKLFEGVSFLATMRFGGQKVCEHCGVPVTGGSSGSIYELDDHYVLLNEEQTVLPRYNQQS